MKISEKDAKKNKNQLSCVPDLWNLKVKIIALNSFSKHKSLWNRIEYNELKISKTSLLQGYQVTIYDLGGSKSFRGIWDKYYHEVLN